ncbi:DUF3275 family protein [Delftia lacustris]|uniref:DUF3275 family protein n=1 Tax=Delftia lacustris TaxID=558537 RepID=UPI00193C3448|nr:DUF3275 family protein [Delftia lacustris]QRI92965.1 DUF3275 family protein [Delftia lacustris]
MSLTATPTSLSPLVVPGQLTLRTIHGRNGPFTVGRLSTHIGVFEVKDPELEQYPEGKYDGQFIIRYVFPKAYPVGGGMRFEIRANLDGMTLYGLDRLDHEDEHSFALQPADPLDEEPGTQTALQPTAAGPTPLTTPVEPLSDQDETRGAPIPFALAPTAAAQTGALPEEPVSPSTDEAFDGIPAVTDEPAEIAPFSLAEAASGPPSTSDSELFGALWPLAESFKLDATVDRRTYRSQIARLHALGYALDYKTQAWSREAELEPA